MTSTLALTLALAIGQAPPQNPAPVPPAPPAAPVAALDPKLIGHLNAWEAKQKQVNSLYANCEMVKNDKLARKERTFEGTVMVMKPNLVWSQMKAKGNPADYEAYIGDGKSLFQYESARKTVTEYKMPKAGVDGNLMLEFLSGTLTAKDVADRFDIRLVKEEAFYVHIELKPRRPKDLQEFDSMLLVLYTPAAGALAYLPSVVRIQKPNGQEEELWTFKQDQKVNNPGVTVQNFKFHPPPPGWVQKQAGK